MKLRLMTTLFFGSILTLLGACSANPTTESEFGDSVRQMVRSQKVFVAEDQETVRTGDGERLEAVLESYRENASTQAGSGGSTILINTGQ